jgi:uncharacterized delta-60 repeat protein
MKLIFTTVILFLLCLQVSAQPGTPDYSFGDSSKVTSETYGGLAYTSLVQPDGKIVVGGGYGYYYKNGSLVTGTLIIRYQEDGKIDLSFGDSGRAIYDFGDVKYSKVVYAVGLQKDGKILAAVRGFSTSSIAIMRLNEDGTVDKSFGKDGLATMPDQDGLYNGMDMAMLPDGRMAITGNYTFNINQGSNPFITCFTPDGFLDKSFGDGGTVVTEPNSTVIISSIAVTKEGKIVIGGQYYVINKTVLLRYNSDGTQDRAFGTNGLAEMSFDRSISSPMIKDIAVTNDNMIVTTGYGTLNSKNDNDVAIASRFLENGAPDSSFDSKGYSTTKYGEGSTRTYAIAVQDNGKLVCAGYSEQGSPVFTAIRYDQDGIIDSSFGVTGV